MKQNGFKNLLVGCLLVIIPLIAKTQQLIPLNNDLLMPINKEINKKEVLFHSSLKPFLDSDLNRFFNYDSLVDYSNRDFTFFSKRKHQWFWRKLRKENLININAKNLQATADPFFNFEIGKEKKRARSRVGNMIVFYHHGYQFRKY